MKGSPYGLNVKWVNMNRIKDESIWIIDCDKNASHGWKQILNPRDKMRKHIVEIIRNAGYDSKMKLKDMIGEGKWQWPKEWNSAYQNIFSIPVPGLNEGKKDRYMWYTKDDKCVNFLTNRAWKDWREDNAKVDWHKYIWFSNCTPKNSFIIWIAVLGRLTTQERLQKWYHEKQLVKVGVPGLVMPQSLYFLDIHVKGSYIPLDDALAILFKPLWMWVEWFEFGLLKEMYSRAYGKGAFKGEFDNSCDTLSLAVVLVSWYKLFGYLILSEKGQSIRD
uniref:Reverse transcriptase zinc-binding domain-containing protein n=1 Tax=Tanacetum cinerariifolium TaxID=118510 RepID=A0A6L2N2G9_TANCI|nr:hypothetical protein [Tanacetum cinerariifolium]